MELKAHTIKIVIIYENNLFIFFLSCHLLSYMDGANKQEKMWVEVWAVRPG